MTDITVTSPVLAPTAASAGSRGASLAGLLVRKVASAVLVLWLAATVTFFALRLVPGDPVLAILGNPSSAPPAGVLAATRQEYGLQHPLLVQYVDYLGRLARGDLGQSYSLKQDVTTVIGDQVASTVVLTLAALATAWVIAALGTLLTVRRGRVVRSLGTGLEVLTAALPQFWLGILLLVVFGFHLGLVPVAGGTGVRSLVLPTLTLAVPLAGFLGQVTRQSFDEAMAQPFVLSARMRGMGDWAVRSRHVLRHALLPGLTLSGWAVGSLFSGAVVVETLFARPGLGKTLLDAVTRRDMPVVLGGVLLIAVVYVVVNLVVDALYLVVDPRLRRPSRGTGNRRSSGVRA